MSLVHYVDYHEFINVIVSTNLVILTLVKIITNEFMVIMNKVVLSYENFIEIKMNILLLIFMLKEKRFASHWFMDDGPYHHSTSNMIQYTLQ